MTQLPPPPAPDPDELASAIVDGVLPPHQAEAARRDPAVARRVEDILRVRAALRAAPPPPEGAADQAVAAALAASEVAPSRRGQAPGRPAVLRVVGRAPGAPPPPTPRRAQHRTRTGAWLAAAAVLVVVLGLVAAGLRLGGGDNTGEMANEESTGEVSSPANPPQGGPTASREESAEGGSDTAVPDGAGGAETADAAVPDLGAVADVDELQRSVADNLVAGRSAADQSAAVPQTGSPSGEFGDSDCPGLAVSGDVARGTQTFVATAELDGELVRVHVYEHDGRATLVATDSSCVDTVSVPFTG